MKLLTLYEVADILGASKSFVHQHWPEWIQYGVKPLRLNGNPESPLRFRPTEIEDMLKRWESKGGAA